MIAANMLCLCDRCDRKRKVLRLLERHIYGLREAEIAQAINVQRRTINNDLRHLEHAGLAHREGVLWLRA